MLQSVTWLVFFILIILVIYSNAKDVAGWNRGAAFVLAATCFVLSSVMSGFFMSVAEIPDQVRRGTLDFVITKPVDTQFWVSMRKFNFDQFGGIIAGFGMLIYGVVTSEAHPGLLQWFGFVSLFFSAVVLFYSFNLALMTLGIWLVRVDNLWVLGETILQVARFPLDIFSAPVQRAFMFYIPMAFLATMPSRQLAKGFDLPMVLLGLLWAAVAFLVARWFWRFALTHYTSASS
jgi:ABC-2 type transport system permease protein